ncbi:hypothetical protein PILCRDRAFT_810491 [Piloderma croceum F 1598]|uniref:Transmembrane protein n=1 Tax=Piloderma croceum (strain F 1598) TaxID=765440 RepID=A0A0C3G883_PILCF|nr:hypothetical protein PILCRDRAFT_810491 [Piloderma croceum F 1598]
MTLTVLVSVSLLALVVTARPVPPESEFTQDHTVDAQNALQAMLGSWTGRPTTRSCMGENNVHVRFTSPKEQSAYLEQLDDIAIKAIVPLTDGVVQTDDQRKLYEALGSLNDVDGGVRPVTWPEEAVGLASGNDNDPEIVPSDGENSVEDEDRSSPARSNTSIATSPTLAVLLFSCVAALLGLLFVSLALYVAIAIRARTRASRDAWEMLQRDEKQMNDDAGWDDGPSREKSEILVELEPQLLEVQESLLFNTDFSQLNPQYTLVDVRPSEDVYAPDLITFEDVSVVDSHSSDDDEGPDDFHDASSDPPTPVFDTVPELTLSHLPEDNSDPPIPSLTVTPRSFSTIIPNSPCRRPLQTRELNSSPISRPAWSLRAGEDTSLFVPSPSASSCTISLSTPSQTLPPSSSANSLSITAPVPRRRAYRFPVPEFDIALAMQLRPGLGIGADPAWMVRFLMAMFGWFTVLLTSKKDRQQRLAA